MIAIIAALASLLLPALRRAKTMAVRVNCLSQQRQLAIATGTYVADYNGYLPNKNGGGARYDLASRTGSVRELYYQGYLRDPRFFRCPALVGNGGWNTNVKGYLDAGYLGYQYMGLSTWLWSIPGTGPYTWGAGVYWIAAPRITMPSQYMLIGCNIIDDLAAQSYHNYMEMNWTAHTREQVQGANIVMLDGAAAWYPYTRASAYSAASGANFVGPYWETMIPMRALIVKDDACYPSGSPASFAWVGCPGRFESQAWSDPARPGSTFGGYGYEPHGVQPLSTRDPLFGGVAWAEFWDVEGMHFADRVIGFADGRALYDHQQTPHTASCPEKKL